MAFRIPSLPRFETPDRHARISTSTRSQRKEAHWQSPLAQSPSRLTSQVIVPPLLKQARAGHAPFSLE
jgi:hypothetical protein